VKYRVPARLERIAGNRAVFILPTHFAEYMRQAGITSDSALLDARLNEMGKATQLVVKFIPGLLKTVLAQKTNSPNPRQTQLSPGPQQG
jgi:hypothetical protein